LELAALSAMPSHREKGHWVILIPHIFRYLCFLSIPLTLALTAYVRQLLRLTGRGGVVLVGAALVLFVKQAADLSWPTRDAFSEQRLANAFLMSTFPRERFASDFGFFGRLANFDLEGRQYHRFVQIRGETEETRKPELLALEDIVVITGGARLPWYGCIRCAASIVGFKVPPTWRPVAIIPRALTPYRRESLIIWRVTGPPSTRG
jgi:hypothetical protein